MVKVLILIAALGLLFGTILALSPNEHQPAPPLAPITVQYGDRE